MTSSTTEVLDFIHTRPVETNQRNRFKILTINFITYVFNTEYPAGIISGYFIIYAAVQDNTLKNKYSDFNF